MSTKCIACNTNWCGCGGGALCSSCKQKIQEIEKMTTLTPEQKQALINQVYAGNNKTQ